jgi:hypothetical protein
MINTRKFQFRCSLQIAAKPAGWEADGSNESKAEGRSQIEEVTPHKHAVRPVTVTAEDDTYDTIFRWRILRTF